MEKKKRDPEIRVYPHTRQQIKIMAAQHNMSMQEFVAWLVNEQEKRERKGRDDAEKSL